MPFAFLNGMSEAKLDDANDPRVGRAWSPILIIVVFALTAIGVWFWINHGSELAQAHGPNAAQSTLHLETFVLNLADPNQRSYLRVGIDLGLNQEAKHAQETVPIAEVRDTILTVLSDGKVDDLMTSAGKAKLKQDLLHALQERMPQLGAEEVYFTEFLIQR
jgi:flagellar basal body-associated protein FliL